MRFVTRNVVSQPDGCHRDEAVVERVQVVPVALQDTENGSRNQKSEDDDNEPNDHQVDQPDVEYPVNRETRFKKRLATLGQQNVWYPYNEYLTSNKSF